MLEDKLFDLEGTLPDSLIKSLWMIDDFVELKSLTWWCWRKQYLENMKGNGKPENMSGWIQVMDNVSISPFHSICIY